MLELTLRESYSEPVVSEETGEIIEHRMNGFRIALTGMPGSGKSSQAAHICLWFLMGYSAFIKGSLRHVLKSVIPDTDIPLYTLLGMEINDSLPVFRPKRVLIVSDSDNITNNLYKEFLKYMGPSFIPAVATTTMNGYRPSAIDQYTILVFDEVHKGASEQGFREKVRMIYNNLSNFYGVIIISATVLFGNQIRTTFLAKMLDNKGLTSELDDNSEISKSLFEEVIKNKIVYTASNVEAKYMSGYVEWDNNDYDLVPVSVISPTYIEISPLQKLIDADDLNTESDIDVSSKSSQSVKSVYNNVMIEYSRHSEVAERDVREQSAKLFFIGNEELIHHSSKLESNLDFGGKSLLITWLKSTNLINTEVYNLIVDYMMQVFDFTLLTASTMMERETSYIYQINRYEDIEFVNSIDETYSVLIVVSEAFSTSFSFERVSRTYIMDPVWNNEILVQRGARGIRFGSSPKFLSGTLFTHRKLYYLIGYVTKPPAELEFEESKQYGKDVTMYTRAQLVTKELDEYYRIILNSNIIAPFMPNVPRSSILSSFEIELEKGELYDAAYSVDATYNAVSVFTKPGLVLLLSVLLQYPINHTYSGLRKNEEWTFVNYLYKMRNQNITRR